ncbi:4-hydroxy-tetrahydrodipicolinate reductase [Taklimakanibacter albus]|uniref:4-hydroxy-tetrahydrodipicolinate reductase n=1 Tax=Taklimakanibacter albus TaxID=2800327 RepID=A0ACC5RE49_9HYPH|nr:4-hydroxy-tetrahydrodipicolinate reductase [Aestuariivirga sp. YIM B02566]MBK1870935.1 4-hydroxy-tetrahydrodipicolinate reductase [Aestuariivirga sp. YIM B02566]
MKIAIAGAAGRMGRVLTRIVHETEGLEVAGGIEPKGSSAVGADMGELAGLGPLGVKITDEPLALFTRIEGLIDFTVPKATLALAELSAQARIVHVIGTTGIDKEGDEKIKAAARHARIVKSGNMSLGVNLLAALVRKVAATLGPDFDIEVLEMHHKHKIDAPSGTALLLGQAAAEGRKLDLTKSSVRARDGHTGARPEGHIGFATLRGGSVVGEHTVMFAGPDERIELTHRAASRDLFARGAVRATLWAQDKKPGLYSMADVLGLE